MVIGTERTNWYSDHPPACTCAVCTARRTDQIRFDELTQGRKVGRNEPCPCGSGKKYKKCHGAVV
ncbi:MAG: SEC-C metal-binding domain-containing protein [Dehalococcoidia bacterium]